MRIAIKFGSHLPVLMKLLEITKGPILELGVGMYSTPYLHYACTSTKRKLTSYDSDEKWIRYFKDCRNDYHDVNFIADWNNLEMNDFWDVAFIDHHPDSVRKDSAKKLVNNAKYVVLHDSNPEYDSSYKYSEIYPLFKYRFDYISDKANTTVLSNFVDLSNLC